MKKYETIEILKESRKLGIQIGIIAGIITFISLFLISCIFCYFIYQSYKNPPTGEIEATQTTETGSNFIKQGVLNETKDKS